MPNVNRVCLAFLLLIALPTVAGRAVAKDLRLFPVEDKKIVLEQSCKKGARPNWNHKVAEATGLKKGEKVWVITRNELLQASLGDLTCFAEGCGGDYLSINLLAGQRGDVEMLGAMKASDAGRLTGTPVQILSAEGACNGLFSDAGKVDFPELKEKRTCERVNVPGGSVFVLATQAFMQENGYPIYETSMRIVNAGQQRQSSNEVVEVDRDTDPLRPVLALTDPEGRAQLVWRKAAGLCCPHRVTVKVSSIGDSGKMQFGPAFEAGGQPCD